jgi:hypothetical protein
MIESPMSSAAFTYVVSPTTLSISLLCAVNTAPDAGFFIYGPPPKKNKKKTANPPGTRIVVPGDWCCTHPSKNKLLLTLSNGTTPNYKQNAES